MKNETKMQERTELDLKILAFLKTVPIEKLEEALEKNGVLGEFKAAVKGIENRI